MFAAAAITVCVYVFLRSIEIALRPAGAFASRTTRIILVGMALFSALVAALAVADVLASAERIQQLAPTR